MSIEPGYYEMRTVVMNSLKETETMHRNRQWFTDIDSFYLAREEWRKLLLGNNNQILKEITYCRSQDQRNLSWDSM